MFDDLATQNFDSLPTKAEVQITETNKANSFLEASAAHAKAFIENCPDCQGSGKWIGGYSNNVVRKCFKCKGTGSLSFKTSPQERVKSREYAAKASVKNVQKKAEIGLAYYEANPVIRDWVAETASWNDFASSLNDSIAKYGKLTDGQLAAAEKSATKHFAKKAEKAKVEKETAVTINSEGLKPVLESFATAVSNGKKRPKMRLDGFALSLAPAHGKNAGHLYVKDGEDYLGKITPQGEFLKPYSLSAEKGAHIDAMLIALGNNPMEAAVAYGRQTGQCSCCGRELTNKDSIALGIGPICAENFGF